jgi:hypothetical protein
MTILSITARNHNEKKSHNHKTYIYRRLKSTEDKSNQKGECESSKKYNELVNKLTT